MTVKKKITKKVSTCLVQFWLQFKMFLKANLMISCPWVFFPSFLQLTAPSIQPVKLFVVFFQTKLLSLVRKSPFLGQPLELFS